jgi:hypothetical protein
MPSVRSSAAIVACLGALAGAVPIGHGSAAPGLCTGAGCHFADPTGARGDFSAAELLATQRITQAAIRRLNAVAARIDGRPAPAAGSSGDRVALTAGQLRINQRIAQAAVRRANRLTALVEGRPDPAPVAAEPGRMALTRQQVRIGRRIAKAALRRAVELDERVPDLPVPRPPAGAPGLLSVSAAIVNRRAMRLPSLPDGRLGDIVAMVLPPGLRDTPVDYGDPVVAEGVLAGGTFYAFRAAIDRTPIVTD